MGTSDLVSVVVPAYNAAATIGQTLLSVRAQTHAALEILVVDDGSRDATAEIANWHARKDPRIRVIQQQNAGVAAARNAGLLAARGDIVAPVDADDVWRTDKISRHLQVLRGGKPTIALVYDWSAMIDGQGRILSANRRPRAQGRVLREMCRANLPGNGSSVTMRRAAALEVGGYDPSLRARGAQGCEDWKLYMQLAERHEVGVVPEILTGYREVPGSMSGNALEMLRSFDLVMDEVRQAHPSLAPDLEHGRLELMRWLAGRAIAAGRRRRAVALLREAAASSRAVATRLLATALAGVANRAVRTTLDALRPGRRITVPFGAEGASGSE